MLNNHPHTKHVSTYKLSISLLLLVNGLFFTKISDAGHLPVWELGVGLGALNAPHYRGSKTRVDFALPFPYAIYRGDIFKVDREEGITGKIFKSERLNLDISLAGSLPVPKTDDSARAGMPSLDLLFEIGPELEYKLWQSEKKDNTFWFKIPYRFVFSVGDPLLQYQGWTFSPYINYRIKVRQFGGLMRYSASIGPIFAGSKYHNYFYEVDSVYVTPERQAYQADSGYSGSRVTVSIARNTKKYFIGLFARYDNLENAVFVDSPLVETTDYFVYGIAFAWIFISSDAKAPH
ncbi:MipA/OmpV family protein [Kaarinaea lacus]